MNGPDKQHDAQHEAQHEAASAWASFHDTTLADLVNTAMPWNERPMCPIDAREEATLIGWMLDAEGTGKEAQSC